MEELGYFRKNGVSAGGCPCSKAWASTHQNTNHSEGVVLVQCQRKAPLRTVDDLIGEARASRLYKHRLRHLRIALPRA